MANGLWGSRLPVVNFLISHFVFLAVRYRIINRRLKNALKRKLRPVIVQTANNQTTAKALEYWLEKGYEKLNIGGGEKKLEGFINLDFVEFPNIVRGVVANILDLSFVPNACVAHIHSNHVLEHLTQSQLLQQLTEYYRILKEDGLLTIRCPNALGAAYGFWFEPILEQKKMQFISLGFPADEKLADPADRWVHKDLFGLLHWFYGDMGNIENQHLNIITPTKMKTCVEQTGFNVIMMSDPEALNIVLIARKKHIL
jgi:SAM-dependent methyltransferase